MATVASLLGAFREAVVDQPDAESVAAWLDRRLLLDSTGAPNSELFATAVLLEFAADARTVRIVACGQPSPLLLRHGRLVEIELAPQPPLGLGLPDGGPPAGLTVPLESGDLFFLASDGVTEARDDSGAFYPLTDRLSGFAAEDPDALAREVWTDLLRDGRTLQDDVTMLVLMPGTPDP
ncbi:Serine/threonine-protein phosphatase OS=Streptomyces alboniger OX=132473 GN=CP975_09630 PE=4 SV=1 [Streptomyces alboniger]